jgi:sensor histidine kinase YesM
MAAESAEFSDQAEAGEPIERAANRRGWARSLVLAFGAGLAATILLAPIYMFEGVPQARALAAGAIVAMPGALLVWVAWRACKAMHRASRPAVLPVVHGLAGLLFALAWTAIIYLLLALVNTATAASYLRLWAPWQTLDGLLLYAATAAIEHSAWARRRLDRQMLATTRAELHALRAQLNPHFLFNALNSIIQLAEEDAAATQAALERLSDLLRHATRSSRGGQIDVTLRAELDFIRSYLALEQLRLGERLAVVEQVADETLDALIPSLLLQPLVENAIVHAIAPRRTGGTIWLSAHVANSQLILEVQDDGPGWDPAAPRRPHGMGLDIVRRQLEIRFPGQSGLRIGRRPEGGASVRLTLPARRQESR